MSILSVQESLERLYISRTTSFKNVYTWEASVPYKRESKPKGNAMTQKYYIERLLLVYIDVIQKAYFQRNQELQNRSSELGD